MVCFSTRSDPGLILVLSKMAVMGLVHVLHILLLPLRRGQVPLEGVRVGKLHQHQEDQAVQQHRVGEHEEAGDLVRQHELDHGQDDLLDNVKLGVSVNRNREKRQIWTQSR